MEKKVKKKRRRQRQYRDIENATALANAMAALNAQGGNMANTMGRGKAIVRKMTNAERANADNAANAANAANAMEGNPAHGTET